MTKILIIYTGGTIGMVESHDRRTLEPFDLDHVLKQVPELNKLNVELDAVSFPKPIDSSDMQPEHWINIAEIIRQAYEHIDGFVILHGSDTLAYTASALSFLLEGLRKPVILTGSQLPIGMIRTDARENLITAVEIAATQMDGQPLIQEVAVYFEYKLYRGNRTSKFSTEAFEAFDSPNYPVLAEAGVHLNFDHHALYHPEQEELTVHTAFSNEVLVVTLFPGLSEHVMRAIVAQEHSRAILLRTFGSGNAPQMPWFVDLLKQYIDAGNLVLNVSQCRKGTVEQGRYATSRELQSMGVLSGGDMTFEAAVTKLMILLGLSTDREWVASHLLSDLRGELSVN